MTIPDPCLALHVDYPAWVADVVSWDSPYRTDEDRMRLAIALSRANVEHDTGGPFGAAIFERESGRLVAVGMNSVVRLSNCTLHGEMVAFMMAQRRLGSFTLNAPASAFCFSLNGDLRRLYVLLVPRCVMTCHAFIVNSKSGGASERHRSSVFSGGGS